MKKLYTEEVFLKAKSKVLFDLECYCCGNTFQLTKSRIKSNEKRNLAGDHNRGKFCSRECTNKGLTKPLFDFNCANCDVSFQRKKKDNRTVNSFCNQTCAAIFNNSKNPKRIKEIKIKEKKQPSIKKTSSKKPRNTYKDKKVICVLCGGLKTKRAKDCQSCRTKKEIAEFLSISKKELFDKRINWQSARTSIQKYARKTLNESSVNKSCMVCSYNKHVECSHIIDVSKFPDDTLLGTINHVDNLIWLCPNHHWEFDNGLLDSLYDLIKNHKLLNKYLELMK